MLFSVIMSDNKQYTYNECVDRGEAKKEREKQYVERVTQIQGEHKFFPWLQTFITIKLGGIQNIFFLPLLKLVSKIFCHVFIVKLQKMCLYST